MHALAYRRYPDVGGCVHVEPPYLNTLYVLGKEVPNVLANFLYLFGGRGLAVVPPTRSGTREFAELSISSLGNRYGVVWKNHGLFCVGATLGEAFDRCVAAEQAARVCHQALALGLEPDLIPRPVEAEIVEAARSRHARRAV